MEKIRINEIVKRGVVCIVKYTIDGIELRGAPSEATLNSTFNAQEIDYLEKDVGIGGTVDVVIVHKEKVKGDPRGGYWVNITNVDMTSAVKGTAGAEIYGTVEPTKPSQEKFRTPTEMVATELTVAAMNTMPEPVGVHTAVKMYKEAIKLLDE